VFGVYPIRKSCGQTPNASQAAPEPNPRELQLVNFIKYWLPLIAYCLLIFIQSSFPSPIKTPDFAFADKFLHIWGYALLGALFFRAYESLWSGGRLWRIALLSVLSAGLYGVSDEIHQYFVPGRSADILDAAADFIGAALGVLCYMGLFRRRSARSPRYAD
jgi:VanZ family protein